MIAIGVGCRKACPADDILGIVRAALAELAGARVPHGLFTLADKRGEPGLEQAAAVLGLPLVFLDKAVLQLVAGGARSCSSRIEDLYGLPSVAETAALAGAGQGATLLVPRRSCPTATCAIAGVAA
ncbi:cobalamin biosynthesis protein [Beijerinckia sp. L45]|uniref:cobalamin biosynthesis protein n=1 Tax=Beijerinckia sp. L45 TaxID=1641855 RepID=UPI00131C4A7F|nr:cobalamin biosynthesis protein [Beijerinckia sp. L45]